MDNIHYALNKGKYQLGVRSRILEDIKENSQNNIGEDWWDLKCTSQN